MVHVPLLCYAAGMLDCLLLMHIGECAVGQARLNQCFVCMRRNGRRTSLVTEFNPALPLQLGRVHYTESWLATVECTARSAALRWLHHRCRAVRVGCVPNRQPPQPCNQTTEPAKQQRFKSHSAAWRAWPSDLTQRMDRVWTKSSRGTQGVLKGY